MYRRAFNNLVSSAASRGGGGFLTNAASVRRSFSPTALSAKSSVAAPASAAGGGGAATGNSGGIEHQHHLDESIVPSYLKEVYWWAYLHPNAIRVFERQWLVDAILWGNFSALRDAALQELADFSGGQGGSSAKEADEEGTISGKTLQIACVYGDFTQRIVKRMAGGGATTLDVVDAAPIQIQNLKEKLSDVLAAHPGKRDKIRMWQQNSAHLDLESDHFDQVILFFLLHEMPEDVRRATLQHALRVLCPGGRMVLVGTFGTV